MKRYRGYYFAIALLGALLVGSIFTYATQYYSILNDTSVQDMGCDPTYPKLEKWCPTTNLCQGPDKPCPDNPTGGDPGDSGKCQSGSPACIGKVPPYVFKNSSQGYSCTCQFSGAPGQCGCFINPTPKPSEIIPTPEDTIDKPIFIPAKCTLNGKRVNSGSTTIGACGCDGDVNSYIAFRCDNGNLTSSCVRNTNKCPSTVAAPTPTVSVHPNIVACGNNFCKNNEYCGQVDNKQGKLQKICVPKNDNEVLVENLPAFKPGMRFSVPLKTEVAGACDGKQSYIKAISQENLNLSCPNEYIPYASCNTTSNGLPELEYFCQDQFLNVGEKAPQKYLIKGVGQKCSSLDVNEDISVICAESECIMPEGSLVGICTKINDDGSNG